MRVSKSLKGIILIFISIVLVQLYLGCNNNESTTAGSPEAKLPGVTFGVPLPDPGIPGYTFPEQEATINSWLDNNDSNNIYLHGWGLWTSLTTPVRNTPLLVYQTWLSPSQIIAVTGTQGKLTGTEDTAFKMAPLEEPRQFRASSLLRTQQLSQDVLKANGVGATHSDTFDIKVSVNYSPDASKYCIQNKIFYKSTLDSLVRAGNQKIPDFPNTALTLKPVYKVIRKEALIDGKYYVLPVWPGVPANDSIPFDEVQWNTYVYVDVTNSSNGTGHIISKGQKPGPENAYNLNDFIHYQLNPQNHVILVAMHVTSREITRWTWQTYWWDPNPDQAEAPSSQGVVNARPAQLKGAARHYAMSIGYTFIQPNQPLTGGNNIGTSIYAFNPYLEAGFDSTTFTYGGLATVITKGTTVVNNVGMRTNCMSCHALATFDINNYSFNNGNTVPYIGNTYIDMVKDSIRAKYLTLDFAWSIQGNIVPGK